MLTQSELFNGLNLVRSSQINSFKNSLSQEDEPALFALTAQQFKEGNLSIAARGYEYLLHLKSEHISNFNLLLNIEFERYRFLNPEMIANDVTEGAVLSHGAFAHVLQGTWKGKPVAIKKMDPLENKVKYWKNFINEVNFHARLKHSNIIELLGVHIEIDACYLIEELADGGALVEAINSRRALPIASITHDVALALNYIHRLGYMHCDVKPDNILIKQNQIKLADFGSIALIGTPTGAGTLQYLPPEAFKNVRNASSDIYALTLTMWQMFTHRQPFIDISGTQLKRRIANGLTETIPEYIPEAYQKIIKMGFNKIEDRLSGEIMVQELKVLCKTEDQSLLSNLSSLSLDSEAQLDSKAQTTVDKNTVANKKTSSLATFIRNATKPLRRLSIFNKAPAMNEDEGITNGLQTSPFGFS